jgi:hypothetical protein
MDMMITSEAPASAATRSATKRGKRDPLANRPGSSAEEEVEAIARKTTDDRITRIEDSISALVGLVAKNAKNSSTPASPVSSETIGTHTTSATSSDNTSGNKKSSRPKKVTPKTILSTAKAIFYHRMKNSTEIRDSIVARLKTVGMYEERIVEIAGTAIPVPKIPWQLVRKETDKLFEELDGSQKDDLLRLAKEQLESVACV